MKRGTTCSLRDYGTWILASSISVFGCIAYGASNKQPPAYSFQDDYCFEYEGTTICYANRGMVAGVNTPAGEPSPQPGAFVGNGTSSYEEIDSSGNVYYSDTLKYHTQGVTMDAALMELGQSFTETLAIGDSSCTTEFKYVLANGKVVVDHNTFCF
jgi:hypothetical protein